MKAVDQLLSQSLKPVHKFITQHRFQGLVQRQDIVLRSTNLEQDNPTVAHDIVADNPGQALIVQPADMITNDFI